MSGTWRRLSQGAHPVFYNPTTTPFSFILTDEFLLQACSKRYHRGNSSLISNSFFKPLRTNYQMKVIIETLCLPLCEHHVNVKIR